MTTKNILDLLQNAIDYSYHSELHSGYTAKELHKFCIDHIKELNKTIKDLKQERENSIYPHLGWGKGKDE